MTPAQKIKSLILSKLDEPPEFDATNVDAVFYEKCDDIRDIMNEVREGECKTGLRCYYSRHYETEAVAAQMLDGSWVGWTYYFGGGQNGSPSEMPWIDDAYDLERLEDKIVVVKQFKIADKPAE